MDRMIAYCGLTCTGCPAYIAARDDNDELRKKTAEEWSKAYGAELKPGDINCDGCIATGGRHIGYCAVCEIRKCGMERGVENCAHCADYACEKLEVFLNQVPAARATLEDIRKEPA